MKTQIHFTGSRKIMNMAKLGTVSQVKKGVQLAENPMKSGLRPIHYAHGRSIGMAGATPKSGASSYSVQSVTTVSGTID
jgi:hypothetical protein